MLDAPEQALTIQFQAGGVLPLSLTPRSTRRIATDITQPLFRKTMYLIISGVPRYVQLSVGTRTDVNVDQGTSTWRVDGPDIRRVALVMAPSPRGVALKELTLTLYNADHVASEEMTLEIEQESALNAWKNRQQFEPPAPIPKGTYG